MTKVELFKRNKRFVRGGEVLLPIKKLLSYFKEKRCYKSRENGAAPINISEPIITPTGIKPVVRNAVVGCKHNRTAKS